MAKLSGDSCNKDSDCYDGWPKCDPFSKVCVQCVTNADCAGHHAGALCTKGMCTCTVDAHCKGPRVFGAECIAGYGTPARQCGCNTSGDCQATTMGPTCDTASRVCTCSGDAQCKKSVYTVCLLAWPSTPLRKTCIRSCKSDGECKKETGRKVCNLAAGACVGCNKDADCAQYKGAPWSLTCTNAHFCVECDKDAHCTSVSLGNKCTTNSKWCTCYANSDCVGNLNGAVCDASIQACSCAKDTDCPAGKTCNRTSVYLPGSKFCQ